MRRKILVFTIKEYSPHLWKPLKYRDFLLPNSIQQVALFISIKVNKFFKAEKNSKLQFLILLVSDFSFLGERNRFMSVPKPNDRPVLPQEIQLPVFSNGLPIFCSSSSSLQAEHLPPSQDCPPCLEQALQLSLCDYLNLASELGHRDLGHPNNNCWPRPGAGALWSLLPRAGTASSN